MSGFIDENSGAQRGDMNCPESKQNKTALMHTGEVERCSKTWVALLQLPALGLCVTCRVPAFPSLHTGTLGAGCYSEWQNQPVHSRSSQNFMAASSTPKSSGLTTGPES